MSLSTAPETSLQYSLTREDILSVYERNYGKMTNGWVSSIGVWLFYCAAIYGFFLFPFAITDLIEVIPMQLGILVALVLGTMVHFWFGRREKKSFHTQLKERILSSIEPSTLLHHTLHITPDGLVEETSTKHTRYSWNNSFEINAIGNEHTQILIGNGLYGAIIVPAQGVEAGDYQRFFGHLHQVIKTEGGNVQPKNGSSKIMYVPG